MSQPKTMEEEFASYTELVLPHDAGPIQISECERAFYAGGYAAFMVLNSVDGPDGVEALFREIERYFLKTAKEAKTLEDT